MTSTDAAPGPGDAASGPGDAASAPGDAAPAPGDAGTVAERLRAAGLSEARIEEHLRVGRVAVDGEIVTDPARPVRRSARLVLMA